MAAPPDGSIGLAGGGGGHIPSEPNESGPAAPFQGGSRTGTTAGSVGGTVSSAGGQFGDLELASGAALSVSDGPPSTVLVGAPGGASVPELYGIAPPPYDEVAMSWVRGASIAEPPPPPYRAASIDHTAPIGTVPPSTELPLEPGPNEFDVRECAQRRVQVVRWSCFCLFVNVTILILGGAVFKRSIGPYTISNWLTLFVFAMGICIAAPRSRLSMVLFGKLYFLTLYVMLFLGTLLGIIYLSTLGQRINTYCDDADRGPDLNGGSGCSDARREQFRTLGILAGLTGLILWIFVFSFFPRVVFIWIVATERSFDVRSAEGSQIRPWLVTMNSLLPNWYRAGRCWAGVGRSFDSWIRCDQRDASCQCCTDHRAGEDCARGCCRCVSQSLACVVNGLTCNGHGCGQRSNDFALMMCCVCCCLGFIISLVLCIVLSAPAPTEGGELSISVWCYITEFFIQLFFNAAAASTRNGY